MTGYGSGVGRTLHAGSGCGSGIPKCVKHGDGWGRCNEGEGRGDGTFAYEPALAHGEGA